jgi:prepilin-type N-terminal cleavage/methylation domain-containing protein/prepilin-type processing-associated H-X9-DG protein
MTCQQSSRARQGFTLIELLVSIAIISLLISILMPALSGAKREARGTLCMTRMRSQGQAMQIYANENEGAMPLGEDTAMHHTVALLPGLGYQSVNILPLLYNLANQAEFIKLLGTFPEFQCPDFPNDDQNLDFVVNSFLMPYPFGDDGGQAGAGYTGDGQGPTVQQMYVRLNLMKQSSARVIFTTEAHKNLPTTDLQFHDLFMAHQLPFGSFPRIANDLRHPNGINASFFDGHAERMNLHNLDAGWPKPAGERLRYFTTVP